MAANINHTPRESDRDALSLFFGNTTPKTRKIFRATPDYVPTHPPFDRHQTPRTLPW